jgi:hypothetical protein
MHSNGFSLVWLRSWRVRCSSLLNARWQVVQTWILLRSSLFAVFMEEIMFGGGWRATSIIPLMTGDGTELAALTAMM